MCENVFIYRDNGKDFYKNPSVSGKTLKVRSTYRNLILKNLQNSTKILGQ